VLDNIEFSGFGRVVAGYLDESNVSFGGYEDTISFDQQSLFGLQADVQLTETLSLTTQLLAHSGDNRDSGIEWLYLTYTPTLNTQIRLGKQRTQFYSYSDVLDVGYAYPWITPPKGVYNDYLFSAYNGINLQYSTTLNDTLVSIEGYWGSDDSEMEIVGERFRPNVNDLRGIIVKFNGEKLSGRVSAHEADLQLHILPISGLIEQLSEIGFEESARTLSGVGRGRFYHAGLKYEELNWFVEAEYNQTRSNVITIPTIKGLAITAAYSWHPLTLFGVASTFDSDFNQPVNEIPIGISPELDRLALGYQQVFSSLVVDDSNFYTLGLRHDVSSSMAIKLSATLIDGDSSRRSFFLNPDDDFNRRAMLYQAALEWVF
jgi:hypothetical protein